MTVEWWPAGTIKTQDNILPLPELGGQCWDYESMRLEDVLIAILRINNKNNEKQTEKHLDKLFF